MTDISHNCQGNEKPKKNVWETIKKKPRKLGSKKTNQT